MRVSRAEAEAILEPHLPIVDAHHHLWDHRLSHGNEPRHPLQAMVEVRARYLVDEFLADIRSGHNIAATVFVQAGRSFYRQDGPEMFRPVGETEFVLRATAGLDEGARICAAIVGYADLGLGDAVASVLEAQVAAGQGRFRGLRNSASWDADPAVMGSFAAARGLYASDRFREGMAHLDRLGLSFDAWLLEPQLTDLIDLAWAFPNISIILDHLGTPLGIGAYADRQDERFPLWREAMRKLAECPNVTVKLGGLGMPFLGLDMVERSSDALAEAWRRYILTAIELFGADRCMFESNYPAEAGSCTYDVLWNAFKRIVTDFSAAEKAMLFSGTARRVYRIAEETWASATDKERGLHLAL